MPGIANGVLHRIPIHLHAQHLLAAVGSGQANGPNAAVGIQHRLLARKMGCIHRQAIQNSGLDRVYLIKTAGADRIALTAQFIKIKPLP